MAGGRPSLYQPEYAQKARELCERGATTADLAEFFQVSTQTIRNWSHEHVDFFEALKIGKAAADERVEASLYHKAIGYSFDAVKIFQHQGQVVEAPYREHVPPDTTAAIFWLKNRKPQEWRDRHEHTGADGAPLLSGITINFVKPDSAG